jgi:hypothetical protein
MHRFSVLKSLLHYSESLQTSVYENMEATLKFLFFFQAVLLHSRKERAETNNSNTKLLISIKKQVTFSDLSELVLIKQSHSKS